MTTGKTKTTSAANAANAEAARTEDFATAEDTATASRLIASTGKPIGVPLSLRLVTIFSNPAQQKKLLAIEQELAVFDGCDVTGAIDLANEGKALLGVYDRLINSAGAVRQRYVQLNQRLGPIHTSLGKAAVAAAAKGPVAMGLVGITGLKKSAATVSKSKRTKNKNKKKKPKGT